MDGVLVDSHSTGIDDNTKKKFKDQLFNAPDFFKDMLPLEGAIDAYKILCKQFDTYILTAAPWGNPTAANNKIDWVKKYLPDEAYKRIIISHNKNLCMGDYLVDDSTRNGAGEFSGEHIHFGTDKFPDWKSVLDYLSDKS
jgi:5'-nucleotidase